MQHLNNSSDPHIKKVIELIKYNREMREIDKAKLNERIEKIDQMSKENFFNASTTTKIRLWHYTELQLMHEHNYNTFMIIGNINEDVCPICMRMHGKYFNADKFYRKITNVLGETNNIFNLDNCYEEPQIYDLDNKSPQEFSRLEFFPPFHNFCRCQIVAVW